MSWEIAFLSIHGDPLAPLGGPHHGGQNVYVKELSRYLGALGLRVDVYSRWESENQQLERKYSRGTRVIRIPIGPAEILPKEQTLSLLPDIASWILRYQTKQGRSYRLLHSHYYFSGAAAIHLKSTRGIPLVHTFHSLGAIKEQTLGNHDPSPSTRVAIERRICQAADRIIATNPQEKIDLIEHYQAHPDKIAVIPCGVNLSLFQPRDQIEAKKAIGYTAEDFLITYVGRLEERKGIDTLLEAVSLINDPGIQVVIVGGPPASKPFLSWRDLEEAPFHTYQQLIEKLGLENRVTFTGGKPQKVLPGYYSAADATVVPSYYEPFGLTAVEALACGSSVIASRVGGLKSTIKEGKVGALFAPRSAAELAEKIKIYRDSPDMVAEYRRAARPYVEENFSWKVVTRQVANLYGSLLEEKPSSSSRTRP